MTKCTVCGVEELLPFTCPHCGRQFCAEHRLPENHNCTGAYKMRPTTTTIVTSRPRTRLIPPLRPRARVSKTDLRHLIIGIFVVFLVEASPFLQTARRNATFIIPLFTAVALAFALHELAHKFTAQRYGLLTAFRVDAYGIVLSLFTVFLPVKFVAPGAVFIYGYPVTRGQEGKIALAGPLINIIQSTILLALIPTFPTSVLMAALNADLALFNLAPVSLLDGKKVYAWSKKVWAASFAVALAIWIATFSLRP